MDRLRSYFQRISDFLHSPLFSPSFMLKVHFVQMILVIIMISLTGARVAIKPAGMPVTRSDTLGIVMVGWTSMISYTWQRRKADVMMIGYQNFGGALVPTHDNSLRQVSTLAKSQGVPGSEYYGDSFLVCGCYNHFHGNIAVLSEYILRVELVDCPDRHHFDVRIASFIHSSPYTGAQIGKRKLTS